MTEVTRLVRRAHAGDEAGLIELFERCSRETRYRRWHGHTYRFPPTYLAAALAGDDAHLAYVAVRGEDVVGIASAVIDPLSGSGRRREVAILVEDAWQRRGIGAALLARLVQESGRRGTQTIRAEVLADDAWLVGLLRRHGPATSTVARGVIDATVQLRDWGPNHPRDRIE